MRDEDCNRPGSGPIAGQMSHAESLCEGPRRRGCDLKRKEELFHLAKTIATLVEAGTQQHERCFLRQQVELLLDR